MHRLRSCMRDESKQHGVRVRSLHAGTTGALFLRSPLMPHCEGHITDVAGLVIESTCHRKPRTRPCGPAPRCNIAIRRCWGANAVHAVRPDSSRAGQWYNGQGYVGFSSSTYGTLTVFRQNSLTLDGVIDYDPLSASNAFSPIGFQGITCGGGNTENCRNSTSWPNNAIGQAHAGTGGARVETARARTVSDPTSVSRPHARSALKFGWAEQHRNEAPAHYPPTRIENINVLRAGPFWPPSRPF
jgi:hypothetical protein